MFDPISAAIAAGLTLVDTFSNKEASKASQANLTETQRMNEAMLRMAKAGKTDAFGNRLTFDDALNEWTTQLTPSQQSLMKGGEREQRLNLLDADRDRLIRSMMQRTGRVANDQLTRNLAMGGTYDRTAEGANRAELTRLINAATPAAGARRDTQPGGAVINRGPSGSPQQRLAQIMLQARTGALGETGQRQGIQNNRFTNNPALASMSGMGMGGGAQLPNVADKVNASQDAATQRLIAAIGSANQNSQAAFGNVAKTADVFDPKAFASVYAAMQRSPRSTGTGKNTKSASVGPYPTFNDGSLNWPGGDQWQYF